MNTALIILNALTGVLMIILTSNQKLPIVKISKLTKTGLWIGSVGLVAQSLRTGYMTYLGDFPFNDLPIWMLKDVGYWCITLGLLIHALKGKDLD